MTISGRAMPIVVSVTAFAVTFSMAFLASKLGAMAKVNFKRKSDKKTLALSLGEVKNILRDDSGKALCGAEANEALSLALDKKFREKYRTSGVTGGDVDV